MSAAAFPWCLKPFAQPKLMSNTELPYWLPAVLDLQSEGQVQGHEPSGRGGWHCPDYVTWLDSCGASPGQVIHNSIRLVGGTYAVAHWIWGAGVSHQHDRGGCATRCLSYRNLPAAGQVYDATPFLKDHPGGADSILLVAGTDATEEFDAIHSTKAKAQLLQYALGRLAASAPAAGARRARCVS